MSTFIYDQPMAKKHQRGLFFVTIIFLIATISFAAGYLLSASKSSIPIIIEKGDCPVNPSSLKRN